MADWLDSHHGSEVSEKSIFAALSQYWEEQFHVDMDSLNVSTQSFRAQLFKANNVVSMPIHVLQCLFHVEKLFCTHKIFHKFKQTRTEKLVHA